MEKTTWARVERIIDEALTRSGQNRHSYIEEECKGNEDLKSWVTELLDSIESSEGFLETGSADREVLIENMMDDISDSHSSPSLIGQQFGAYEITELIGHGGMGSIYLAERKDESFKHRVAIKIIRRGMDTPSNIARFKQEQNILAGLHHPNIARLYDGGVTDGGLPYLVMEYIDGHPIDKYCEKNNLTIDERLELFKSVCNAVQYAHNNLIIHRDLKPDNILVTKEGHVKILDFGIAKLLDPNFQQDLLFRTQAGSRILTLAYAAPEQLTNGKITTAADSYALGIVLYKLLTSLHPFELEGNEINMSEAIIKEKAPPKASRRLQRVINEQLNTIATVRKTSPIKLIRLISGDLDAILNRALRKDPLTRYKSVEQFVEDLDRFITGKPVLAREGNIRYRGKKFIQRNKLPIAISAVFILLLIGFTAFYTSQITEERNQARLEAQKAGAVTDFLTQLIEANAPDNTQGQTVTIREFLESGFQEVQKLNETPLVQAEVLTTMGQTYRSLGDIQKASTLMNNALEILEAEEVEDQQIATSYNVYAIIQRDLGNYDEAQKALQKSIEMYQVTKETNTENYAKALRDLAYIERLRTNYEHASNLIQQALDIEEKLYDIPNIKMAETLYIYASILRYQNKLVKATQIQKESLEIARKVIDGPHPGIASNLVNLANLYDINGERDKSTRYYKEALQMSTVLYGNQHQEIANISNNLSGNYLDAGLLDSAEYHVQKAFAVQQKINPGSPRMARIYNRYAKIYTTKNKWVKADSLLTKAEQILQNKPQDYYPDLINIKTNKAHLALQQSQFNEAKELLDEIEQIRKDGDNILDPPLQNKIDRLTNLLAENSNK